MCYQGLQGSLRFDYFLCIIPSTELNLEILNRQSMSNMLRSQIAFAFGKRVYAQIWIFCSGMYLLNLCWLGSDLLCLTNQSHLNSLQMIKLPKKKHVKCLDFLYSSWRIIIRAASSIHSLLLGQRQVFSMIQSLWNTLILSLEIHFVFTANSVSNCLIES